MTITSQRLAILTASCVLAIASTVSAEAQIAVRRPVPRGQVYGQNTSAVAFERGQREGLREGETDARRNDRFDFRDERAWQRADSGYHSDLGRRDVYERAFRDGFERGYAAAYRGRQGGRYGNDDRYGNGGYGSGGYGNGGYGNGRRFNEAFETGLRDGYEEGLKVARKSDRYDPVGARRYRSGDNGYDRRFGTKDQWKLSYREGFKDGYDRGYREGRYR
ncbi:MAG: hypothetical protein M3R55_04350 [Acidobacteriota bacterium]|nr:hypothetical protein [Acidobacteriota bacterium]